MVTRNSHFVGFVMRRLTSYFVIAQFFIAEHEVLADPEEVNVCDGECLEPSPDSGFLEPQSAHDSLIRNFIFRQTDIILFRISSDIRQYMRNIAR